MKHKIVVITCVLCAVASLSACDNGVKRALGLKKHTPDEFMVMSRPPLTVPPDFSLVPPSDVDVRPQSKVREEAKDVLFSDKTSSKKPAATLGRGEAALLQQAGTDEAKPDIREILNQESTRAREQEEDKGMLESLIEPLRPAKKDPLVDIDKEEERLEKNKEEGKAPNEGEVPSKKGSSKGILNDLLSN